YRTEVGMVGDALLTLRALNLALEERLTARPADAIDGHAVVAKAREEKFGAFQLLAQSVDTPIKPELVVDALNRLLPREAIVVADPGTPCPYFSAYFDAPQSCRHFITNRAHVALGFAMAAAVGAQFGLHNVMLLSVVG